MSQEFVGSLDCGTTSTRFIVFDRYANIVAQHQIEFPQYHPEPGWHEHDPDQIIQACEDCIDGAVKSVEAAGYPKSSIRVIGITNQRETTVAWSRRTGKPLAKAIVWADSRTKHTVAHLINALNNVGLELEPGCVVTGKEATDQLQTLTGLKLSTYFSGVKLRWLIDHHEAVHRAHEDDDLLFGTVESWIVYRLTDRKLHVTEVSNASRTLLMNIKTLQWDPVLLRFFRIKPSVLPKIVSSSQVYGEVEHGSLKGVKIGGLIGDQQGALVGNKCFHQGEAKCTFGTGAFLLFNTGNDVVKSDNGLLTTVGYQAGPDSKPVYALEGSIAVAGSAIKWLRDSMYMIKSSADINTLAASVDTTGGVYFVTAFSGLLAPYWDPAAAGMLIGLTEYTTPAHIARATLEATAFQTYAILECMQSDAGADLKQVKVDGGMTNGDVAMQILADLGGFAVMRPEMRESTALGSALLAGSAIRLFGWDVNKQETLADVNTKGHTDFVSRLDAGERKKRWVRWQRAVERSRGWDDHWNDEDDDG